LYKKQQPWGIKLLYTYYAIHILSAQMSQLELNRYMYQLSIIHLEYRSTIDRVDKTYWTAAVGNR